MLIAGAIALGCVALAFAFDGSPVIERVSVSAAGVQGSFDSFESSMSGDGRYVAFSSRANNLVAGDTNDRWDVFVKDRVTGAVDRVSISTAGEQGNEDSRSPSISADGRYVAFASYAWNLTPTNGADWDIFVRDRVAGTTERISVSAFDSYGGYADQCSISADGRFVAFSSGSNLVAGDDGRSDIYVKDRQAGTIQRATIGYDGSNPHWHAYFPEISADGRFVAFISLADNLVPGDTNGEGGGGAGDDVFVWNRLTGAIERVSISTSGQQGNAASGVNDFISISGDGRFVSFSSYANNLTPADGGPQDIFVRDRLNGTTEMASVSSDEEPGNWTSGRSNLSADGRYVVFASGAGNLAPEDMGFDAPDIYLRDRTLGLTTLINFSTPPEISYSYAPKINATGRYVSFASYGVNLVPGDTNNVPDVFVRDLGLQFGLTMGGTQVVGGNDITGEVILNGPAPAGGYTVTLSDNSGSATTPASVLVPAGASRATFVVTTSGVDYNTNVKFTATLNGEPKQQLVKIKPASLLSIALTPDTVYGGLNIPVKARVTLDGKAGPVGFSVDMTSSNTAAATVPSTATVTVNKNFVDVPVTHNFVPGVRSSIIRATVGAVVKRATLTVNPMLLQSVVLNRTSVTGGTATFVTAKFNLAVTTPTAVDVTLSSSHPSIVTLPATVRIAANKSTVTLTLVHQKVATDTNVTITATLGSSTESAVVKVLAPAVKELTLNPATVTGGNSSQGTVVLTAPAPAGGLTVSLSSSRTAATVPTSVFIAEGATQATFGITTSTVGNAVLASITATLGSGSKKVTLTVNP